MKARCSRASVVLIRSLMWLVSACRAVWRGIGRVRLLPIGVQKWDNGITFGILIIIYTTSNMSPANGKESDNALR